MHAVLMSVIFFFFFFFNDTATTEIYTLSLHDALPIWPGPPPARAAGRPTPVRRRAARGTRSRRAAPIPAAPDCPTPARDRKSTRLNSSHGYISYAVFCLKKKKTQGAVPTLEPAAHASA